MPTLPLDDPTTRAAADDPAPADVVRFRAATFDEAVALAAAEYGDQVDVVEANRVRRGGIGGFFATELGVEIAVRPPAPTGPQTEPQIATAEASTGVIDRLLAQAEATERAAAPSAAFADVLARELGPTSPKPAADGDTIADWSHEVFRRLAIPEPARGPEPPAPESPAPGPSAGGSTEAAVGSTGTRATTEPPAPTKQPAAKKPAAKKPTSKAAAPKKGSSARRSTRTTPATHAVADTATVELVAHSTTQLLAQLANVPAAQTPGTATVAVKVTLPTGAAVELTATLTSPDQSA